MSERPTPVWLRGERTGIAYLLDPVDGTFRRYESNDEIGPTAGDARRVRRGPRRYRGLVALYADPSGNELRIRIRDLDLPVADLERAEHRSGPLGARSTLTIEAPDGRVESASLWTWWLAVTPRFDPAYDDLDASLDDFLGDVADILKSPGRRADLELKWDARNGPWDLLRDDGRS